jgi:hypothetical protein
MCVYVGVQQKEAAPKAVCVCVCVCVCVWLPDTAQHTFRV